MGRGLSWTMHEEQKLAELLARRPRLPWATIARQVGRSVSSCATTATRLRQQQRIPPARTTAGIGGPPRSAPLPGSRLEALLHHLLDLAHAGEPLERIEDLPDVIGAASASGVSRLFRELELRGLVKVTASWRGIERVTAADGSWSVAGAVTQAAPRVRRRCLSCELPFDSEHRHNFICAGCKSTDVWRWGDAA